MATFNLTIVSAEQKIFEGEVKQIQVTGVRGAWYFARTCAIANSN